jgi:glycerate kinase
VLETRLEALACRFCAETGVDVRALPGAGAAGGLGGAFMAYFGASCVSGIDKVLELVHFKEVVKGADLIITGEGKSDRQTLSGKVPLGVLRHAQGIPVVLLSGRIEDRAALLAAGFSELIQVSPSALLLDEAIQPAIAKENLRLAVSNYFKASGSL